MRFTVDMGEVELVITYSFTPEVRAKVNCLPDDSHPAEAAEIEIESVMSKGFEYLPLLEKSVLDELEEQALNHVINSAIDDAEQKADWVKSQTEQL